MSLIQALSPQQVSAGCGAAPKLAELYLPLIQETCTRYSISTPRRISAFLSQIGHESAGLTRTRESLNYSVEGLLSTFSRKRISEEQARRFGRTNLQRANQEALANILYGGEFGLKQLGNVKPDDGWNFVGRGLKQITGRDNYTRCGKALGLDLVNKPEQLEAPYPAALSAGWFWGVNSLNDLADAGRFELLTQRINGGTLGLQERLALYNSVVSTFA